MNKATKCIVATLGVIFGISGMSHGLFEILQGNTPTGSAFIAAIGTAQKMWSHGNEFALTLIPNFLVTGIAAMLVGIAIILWSVGFVHKRHGSLILFLLFMTLLLVGGGVAQILFFPFICLAASRINKPLNSWRKVLPPGLRWSFGRLWSLFLAISSFLLVFILQVGITGFVPGVGDPDSVLTIMLGSLGMQVVLLPLAFISGFAHDIAARPELAAVRS